jgi:chemotaxis protein MotB
MARKRKRDSGGGASWLETYSDMVTLLLTFFIMLYAMSTIDAQKYAIIVEAFSKGTEVEKQIEELSGTGQMDGGSIEVEEADEHDIDQLYEMLKSYVDENNLSESVEISKSEEYVFIRFSDNITFKGYSNNLNQSGRDILDVLANGLNLVDEYVEEVIIAGHTAEVEKDKSNIDRALSTDRANAVLQYLESKNVISPAKYLAIGYGLYSPIADNSTPEGRAKNRRVEIFISRKGHPISYTEIIKDTINGDDNTESEDKIEYQSNQLR